MHDSLSGDRRSPLPGPQFHRSEAWRCTFFPKRYALKEELPEEGATAIAGKKTQETLTGTDSIIEALDVAEAELKRIAQHEDCNNREGNILLQKEYNPHVASLLAPFQ